MRGYALVWFTEIAKIYIGVVIGVTETDSKLNETSRSGSYRIASPIWLGIATILRLKHNQVASREESKMPKTNTCI